MWPQQHWRKLRSLARPGLEGGDLEARAVWFCLKLINCKLFFLWEGGPLQKVL